MHIVLVSSQHHPTHGGIGAYVWNFAQACRECGWKLELVTRSGAEELLPPAHRVHEITTEDMRAEFEQRVPALRRIERIRPYRYGLWSLAAAQRLQELNGHPDVIEFVDCQAQGWATLTTASIRSQYAYATFMVSSHTPMWLHEQNAGEDAASFGRSIYHAWEKQALHAADGVIAPSQGLLGRLGLNVPSACMPLPMGTAPAREPSGSQMILLIGAVQPQKGVDVWARSLNRVLLAKPKATAVLIGADTPTAPDGLSMAAHVQRLIDSRVIDRFRWIGSLNHEHVMRFIEEAAMVVVPSVFESFSFAAAEALMRGRPVIVSENVGLREHVPGLRTVPVGDAEALTEAQLMTLGDLKSAHERARELRTVLIEKCAPAAVLDARQRFHQQLRIRGKDRRLDPEADGIAEMSSWLRSVEEQEAAVTGSRATLAA